MKKLQGMITEVKSNVTEVKKEVPVFKETFRSSNAIYMPVPKSTRVIPSRKERMKKFLIGVTVTIFLLAVVVLSILTLISNNEKLDDQIKWVPTEVTHGDTLWNLVQQPEGNNKANVQYLIELTKEKNKLSAATLRAGITIEVPVIKGAK